MKKIDTVSYWKQKKARLWLLLLSIFCLGGSGAFAQIAPYCGVTFSSNVEPITYVNFAGFTKTSPAATGGTDDHEDFTADTIAVNAGATYAISLNGNTDGASFTTYFWVYADWNQNGVFTDPGEFYAASSVTGHDGETDDPSSYAQADISIPPTALGGTTRFRVLKKYNASTNPGACNTSGYGQAEDYTLNVTPLACTPPTATFTPVMDCANNQYSVSVDVTSLGNATQLVLTDGTIDYGPPITAPGTYIAGPFVSGASVTITLEHNVEILCSINSGVLTEFCPPLNDECADAVVLTVNPDLNCGTVTHGTVNNATASPDAAVCSGTEDDDVWYTFTATASSHQISLINVANGTTDMYMQLLDGCGGTSLFCSDPNSFLATGLTPGNTYVLRVYTWTSTVGQTSEFDVCIGTLPPPPANDEPAGAVALSVNTDLNCGVVTAGTTISATASTETAPSCSSAGTNDDVWYTFVATGASHQVSVSNTSSTIALAVYSGTPGSLTQVSCNSTTGNPSGLTPGETYYVRAYTTTSTSTTNSNFDICVGTPPPPPANDDPSGAVALTVGGGCPGTLFTSSYATRAVGEPVNSCYQPESQNYPSVWFSFVAPASGAVRVSTDYSGGTLNDTHLGVFSAGDVNDYATFIILACDDDNGTTAGGGSPKSIAYATGLTAGSTYYVMVNGYNNQSGDFCVTVDELAASMLASTADCSSGQTVYRRPSFNGMSSLVDNDGLLRAIVKNNTVVPEASTISMSGSLTINDGAVRTDDNGLAYLDRNILINTTETGNFDVQLFFLDTELAALAALDPSATLANMNMSKVSGSTCSSDFSGEAVLLTQTGSGTSSGVSWVTVNTDGFSNFFLASGNIPLPVEVLNFRGQQEGNSNLLLWETQHEVNMSHFDLQRSHDGVNYNTIGRVEANQDNGQYRFVDEQPLKGANHYRLSMVDLDGQIKMSSVVTLINSDKGEFAIAAYPNPATDKITIAVKGGAHDNGQLIITDAVGKVIRSISLDNGEASLDMSNMPSGIYLIKYNDDVNSQVIKVSKQ